MKRKRLSTVVWGVITVAIVVTMLAGGLKCSQPAPTATPAPAAKPTAVPAKVYNTRLTTHWTEQHPMGKWLLAFADEVKTATKGQLTIQVFFNQVLFSNADTVPAVGAGNLEWAAMSYVWWVGLSPEFVATDMPYLLPTLDASRQLLQSQPGQALLAKVEQKSGIKILANWPAGDQYWFTRAKPIARVDDFQGITIRSRGGAWAEVIKGLGSKSIVVSIPETYTALQQGMFEAVPLSTMAPKSFGWDPLLKYMSTPATVPDTPGGLIVNANFFNSLPADVKTAVNTLTAKYDKANYDQIQLESKKALDLLVAGGMQTVAMPPAELARAKTLLYDAVYSKLSAQWDPAFTAQLLQLSK